MGITDTLLIKNVSHNFGPKKVLYDVNLSIPAGQFVSIVGPSGCGKSTLLRAILGTHPPVDGAVYASGVRIFRPNRNVGIVYQHYSLFDFMTVIENVAFGLVQDQTSMPYRFFFYPKWRKLKKQHLIQAQTMLERVGLGGASDQYPAQLSGGQRQRVAIAQTIIMQPKIVLLDEPFGALDEAIREELQDMLVGLRYENEKFQKLGKTPPYTILIVTHELNEAIYLSDRILGLSQYHSKGKEGATIVYDKKATAFDRNSARDFALFKNQRNDLRQIVFNEDSKLHAEENRTFGKEMAKAVEAHDN